MSKPGALSWGGGYLATQFNMYSTLGIKPVVCVGRGGYVQYIRYKPAMYIHVGGDEAKWYHNLKIANHTLQGLC